MPIEQHGDDAVGGEQPSDLQSRFEHLADFERLDAERLAHPAANRADHRARFGFADDRQRVAVAAVAARRRPVPSCRNVRRRSRRRDPRASRSSRRAVCQTRHDRLELAPIHDEAADEVDRVARVAAIGEQRQPLELPLRRSGLTTRRLSTMARVPSRMS